MELTIHSETYQRPGIGDIVMLKPCGPIDQKSVQLFETKVVDFYRKGICKLILDLSETNYLNSTGLGLLINIAHRVNIVGGGVRLINVAEKFRVLFDMLGLESCLPILADAEAAFHSFETNDAAMEKHPMHIESKDPESEIKRQEDIKKGANYLYAEKFTNVAEAAVPHEAPVTPPSEAETLITPVEQMRQDFTFDSFFLDNGEKTVSQPAEPSPLEEAPQEEASGGERQAPQPEALPEDEPLQKVLEEEEKEEGEAEIPKTISRFLPSRPMTKKPLLKKTLGMMKQDLIKKNTAEKGEELSNRDEAPIEKTEEQAIEMRIRQYSEDFSQTEEPSIGQQLLSEAPETKSEVAPSEGTKSEAREPEKEATVESPNQMPTKVSKDLVASKDSTKISQAPERKIERAKKMQRKVTTLHYARMKERKTYPISVTFVSHPFWLDNKDQAQEPVPQKSNLKNPCVTIVPQFPGCDVTPSVMYVNLSGEKASTRFWVTPHTKGSVEKTIPAWVDILYQGKSYLKLKMPFKMIHRSFFYITFLLSFLLPLSASYVNRFYPEWEESFVLSNSLFSLLGGIKPLGVILGGFFFLFTLMLLIKISEKRVKGEEKELTVHMH